MTDLPKLDIIVMFSALARLRRSWHSIRPAPAISQSLFTTLMAIAHAGNKGFPDYIPVKIVDGGVALGDLALMLKQSLPVVSQRIRALEELEYVERFMDAADRRVIRVKLTQSGSREVEAAHTALKLRIDSAMQYFGTENIPALMDMLSRLAEAFEQTAAPNEEIKKEKN